MLPIQRMVRTFLFLAALAIACPACGATIYGTLKRDNRPYPAAAVQLTCNQLQSAGQSDPRGNYSLSIAASGNCILKVDGKMATVNLGSQPARYDFEVPATGNQLLQR